MSKIKQKQNGKQVGVKMKGERERETEGATKQNIAPGTW